ncbi:MAG: iron-sulfur cluster repair di-iron protein [Candidatus Obscuribacterales bacterium]|nr:iron-sulfur cluster repair di-iron protein [Candidatus Obscuribacterales bacterium]
MTNGKTICTVCNYIFDEKLGEPRQAISPAVKFEDLPDNWQCPECNSSKDMFQPCSCVSFHIYEQTCVRPAENASQRESAQMSALPVGLLVSQDPKRACVLEQYGIDYCCGGKVTLAEACRQRNLSLQEVLTKLVAAGQKDPAGAEPDWTQSSLKELVHHIVSSYHQPLRQELPRLKALAEKVAKVHGDNHPKMLKVLDVLKTFKDKLELHMQKEELILFPGISALEDGGNPTSFGCGGGIEHPIEVMIQEHDDAGEAMFAMRTLTNNYTPPEDACDTFKVLLHSLAKLELDMHQHVHKENNILFPRAIDYLKSAAATK